MNIDPYILALVAGGFGTASALLGVWLNHRLSIERALTDAKRIAGFKLREAFSKELAVLASPTDEDRKRKLYDILIEAFPRHHAAIVEFRYYLTGAQLEAFNKIWTDYYRYPNEERQYLIQYYFDDPERVQRAIDRIKAILEFTK
jgi:hypothetical protein